MNKALTYKTSFRATLGQNQFVAWVRTDASVNIVKDVVTITPDYSKQMEELLLGNIEEIDYTAPVNDFFMNGKAKGKATAPFLGYINCTKAPSFPAVLQRLWPSLTFTNHAK